MRHARFRGVQSGCDFIVPQARALEDPGDGATTKIVPT
jgi:hypothetical protein